MFVGIVCIFGIYVHSALHVDPVNTCLVVIHPVHSKKLSCFSIKFLYSLQLQIDDIEAVSEDWYG